MENKVCPLTYSALEGFSRDCKKDKCAWWCDNECAIKTIANAQYRAHTK